jgi:peptide/nickel transport system substrate-binding protein
MTRHLISSTVAVLALFVIGCGDRETPAPVAGASEAGGVAVYCAVNTADALNPFVSSDEAAADMRPLLYTPLVFYDSVGGFKPGLATSWTWSDDHRSLTLQLRQDSRWHDGQPVTAEDVVWTLNSAIDTAYGYWGRGELVDLESVRAVAGGVELRFRKPFAAGLEPLTKLAILPRHILASVPPASFRTAAYHQQPIGNGPFKFTGKLPDGSAKFDRVADYPEDLGRPLLNRIVVKEVPDASAILVELRTGGVDVCTVGSSIAGDAADAGNTIIPVTPVGALIIALDNSKTPFNDVRVRRALSAALNRTEIAAAVSRVAKPARTFLPDASVRWREASILQPDNDPAFAAALLDSAGWRRSTTADSLRKNGAGQPLRFTISAPAPFQNVLTVVQAQLRRAGADVELRLLEPSAFFGLLGQPSTRPAAAAVIYTPERIALPDAAPLFHTNGDFNIASYSNPQVDATLERLMGVVPDDERAQSYREIERHLATDVPVIFTVQTPRMLAVRPRLREVRVDANGPFASAARWWIPAGERR